MWNVVLIDLDQNRLETAKQLGADNPLKVMSKDPKEMAVKIEELMGEQPDITIECSGATPSIQTAIYVSSLINLTFWDQHTLCFALWISHLRQIYIDRIATVRQKYLENDFFFQVRKSQQILW